MTWYLALAIALPAFMAYGAGATLVGAMLYKRIPPPTSPWDVDTPAIGGFFGGLLWPIGLWIVLAAALIKRPSRDDRRLIRKRQELATEKELAALDEEIARLRESPQ